ncbi:MAG: SAM-dependent chlorinase/fluorinase [Candidatus Omnitrophica bacterium]|nr:SAM-dependent chlorinase/fluorinase [Candidatus Omnitrophota bacterium]
MKTIALLTDFGQSDNFVGVMKGVISSLCPQSLCLDITHAVPSWNIRAAAFLLWKSYSFFPHQTVFLVVVDPTVGSWRKILIVKTRHYHFVGPDNGVLSWAAEEDGVVSLVSASNSKYFLPQVSATFQGRDIFAPLAAHIACGVALSRLGRAEKKMVSLEFPRPQISSSRIIAEVIYIDKFGNAILNIKKEDFASFRKLYLKTKKGLVGLEKKTFYHQAKKGRFFLLEGSFGFLEIALKEDSAASYLKLSVGMKVEIILK